MASLVNDGVIVVIWSEVGCWSNQYNRKCMLFCRIQ